MKLALVVCVLPGMAAADMQMTNGRYSCDRGVEVPATYVTDAEQSIAVIHVDGTQITLFSEEAASGVRYGWPSDGSHYVWWTKGNEATLYWHDGETGEEAALLENCKM
jgi:membrane-bound inhibitor of C-type lysozyme